LGIDISSLGPAAQKQVREKLAAQKKERIAAAPSEPRNDRKNKLNAQKTDGYDSKKEAERAAELHWLEKGGKIRDLQEQVKFVLIPAKYEEIPRIGKRGKPIKPKRVCIERGLDYIADFVYIDETGHTVVEDVKGYKGGATYRVFAQKRKMMLEIYGIKVVEV
jgi:hypothetical protein